MGRMGRPYLVVILALRGKEEGVLSPHTTPRNDKILALHVCEAMVFEIIENMCIWCKKDEIWGFESYLRDDNYFKCRLTAI